jgi:hypothetical protein
MSTDVRILPCMILTAALACGDSTGEPTDESTTGDTTGGTTSVGPTTTPVDTGQTQTSLVDTTVATSLDSSTSGDDGTGSPELEVSIEGRTIADGGSYTIALPVDVGDTSETVTVTLANVGGGSLEIAGVALEGLHLAHFVLDDAGLESLVTPGTETSFTVTFAPTNGGPKSVGLRIDNDDADEGAYAIAIDARTTPNAWRDVAPATLPSARFNAALAASDDGRVLLFGGRLGTGLRVADTWVFDVEAGDWTELTPPSAPSARDASAMAWVGNDTMVLFGGNETSGPGGSVTPLADTWTFDMAAATWTELAPPMSPPERFQHAMVTASDGTALLQGGRSEFMMELADTWLFDGVTQAWTDLVPPASPGTRSAFALASDGMGVVVMVGGSTDSTTFVDETWVYDVAGNAWIAGAAAGAGTQLNNAAAWTDGDTFVGFSGKPDCCSNPIPGTWGYHAAADAWTDLAPPTEPAPRSNHRMLSVGNGKLIMFGGLLLNADLTSATAETWEYVGP